MSINESSNSAVACERARPLDQANSRTCVLHAIANAVVETCMDQNLDLKLDELVGAMKQFDFVDIQGNRVEDFDQAVVKRLNDWNTRNLYDIQIQIRTGNPEELLKRLQNKEIKCVLVYQSPLSEPHCVYVKELANALGTLHYVCINSWGPINDILLKEVGQVSTLYEVTVTYEQSKSGRSPMCSSNSSNQPFTNYVQQPPLSVHPPTRDHMHFDSVQSSPVWTPSFNSSYSSSPTLTASTSWINMRQDSKDLETGQQAPADVTLWQEDDEWPSDLTPPRSMTRIHI